MVKQNKRGQLAVETLLIYGVAILIVLGAIAALYASGYLDFGNFFPDKCTIDNDVFECGDYIVRDQLGDNQIQIELKNIMQNNVNIYEIYLEGAEDSTGVLLRADCTNTYDPAQFIISGDKKLFTLSNCSDLSEFRSKKITLDLGVKYGLANSQITDKWAYGSIIAKVSE